MPPQVCIHLGSLLLSCGVGWQNCWRHHRSVTFLASRFLSTFLLTLVDLFFGKKMSKNILVENFESYGDAIISCWCIWFILCDVWDDVSPNFFLKMKCSWSPWQRLGSSIFFLVLSHWLILHGKHDEYLVFCVGGLFLEWRVTLISCCCCICRNLYTRC